MIPGITAKDINDGLLRTEESQTVTESKALPLLANGEVMALSFEDLETNAHGEEQSPRQ